LEFQIKIYKLNKKISFEEQVLCNTKQIFLFILIWYVLKATLNGSIDCQGQLLKALYAEASFVSVGRAFLYSYIKWKAVEESRKSSLATLKPPSFIFTSSLYE